MKAIKTFIKNRKKQRIAVLVEIAPRQKGLAFVMHGLGGFKEQKHITAMAEAFRESGYTVLRFDTTNSIGESGGKYEDATITNYYADLEDVIRWSARQGWYQQPFVLTGHSLGGFCTAFYAENHPSQVKAVAPVSAVVTGRLTLQHYTKEELSEWKRTGWYVRQSKSRPGLIKRLKWSHVMDRLKHDLIPRVSKLTMPVLLVVGDKDTSTPLTHQRILYAKLAGRKGLHVIKGSDHNFPAQDHIKSLKASLKKWISSLD